MTGSVAILVPVLNRPQNVARLLASLEDCSPADRAAVGRVLFVADEGDERELAALADAGADWITVPDGTNYATKINRGHDATTEPLLFLAADDLRFRPHWLERALEHLDDPAIAVVGTNDLCNPRVMTGVHSTHSLVRRSYIADESGVVDEPGKVLHEGYRHEYCDDEFVQTAQARGRYSHAFDALVEHLHPLNGKAEDDATYRLGRGRTAESRRLFRQRRRKWITPAG